MVEAAYTYDFDYDFDDVLAAEPIEHTPLEYQPDLELLPTPVIRQKPGLNLAVPIVMNLTVAALIICSTFFISVYLTNETMRMMIEANHLKDTNSTQRSHAHDLESIFSALSTPRNIMQLAGELNMVLDIDPEYIHIDPASAAPVIMNQWDNSEPHLTNPDTQADNSPQDSLQEP